MALIAKVHDTHANLWSSLQVRPPAGACQLPVTVRFIENRAVVTDAAATGLKRGDVIDQLDAVSVAKLVQDWSPYYAASNEPIDIRNYPGAFHWGPPLSIEPKQPHYSGKVVILVDEVSQSQAEYTTMAFRSAHATVIGSTTAGADGNVSQFALPRRFEHHDQRHWRLLSG